MKRRRMPRSASTALESLTRQVAPVSLLGDVQRAWPEVAGAALSGRATPTAAHAGVVTLTCESAVWAHELTLMAPQLATRLNSALGDGRVVEVRCQAGPGRRR
jgi:predicted nucleic acid-binding Zn ribbon protein